MRTLFLGSGPFAVPTLDALVEASGPHEMVKVISRPDRPARRGRKLLPMPVKARCAELGVDCSTPNSVNDSETLTEIRGLDIDLCVVADYGEILRRRFLDVPRLGTFNLHGSILPKYRGAAPIVHAMLRGEAVTGVTLFRIEEGLDSGPIVAIRTTEIDPRETAGELEPRLALLGAQLLVENLPAFADETFAETAQNHEDATLAPKIDKEMGRIDWSKSADEIDRAIRAFNPWPTAYSFLDLGEGATERTAILKASPVPDSSGASPGSVALATKTGFSIACGEHALEILELQRQGKAAMDVRAYLNGRSIRVGDRFLSTEEAAK